MADLLLERQPREPKDALLHRDLCPVIPVLAAVAKALKEDHVNLVPNHEDHQDRLEARLAGLATDFAYTATALIAHSTDDGIYTRNAGLATGSVAVTKPIHKAAAAMQLLGHATASERALVEPERWEAHQRLKAKMDHHVAQHPQSAAAVLRTVVEATPRRDTHAHWHEGPRAQVKADARAGNDDARAVHEARTMSRWQEAPVALRRAVIGSRTADDPPAAAASPS
ncbi:MAG TPA: hypothetical protein VFR90_05785 [Methylibium sp.]|uniref:hypothetical protein n=1 Tax=Methylibium sp. TaxID=2067992 RepID=UPI002DBD1EB9|nr:hypothetical protein [Methylibium sp.]HEU4458614.1 hypothetical protein [Methylibium sp.]